MRLSNFKKRLLQNLPLPSKLTLETLEKFVKYVQS